jgi:hypothetical protein
MKTHIPINRWQESIQDLPWNPKNAAASAIKALSQFYWRDVPKDYAIDYILSLPAASYLRENPFILCEAWEHVLREMTGDSIVLLELEPIFETAA